MGLHERPHATTAHAHARTLQRRPHLADAPRAVLRDDGLDGEEELGRGGSARPRSAPTRDRRDRRLASGVPGRVGDAEGLAHQGHRCLTPRGLPVHRRDLPGNVGGRPSRALSRSSDVMVCRVRASFRRLFSRSSSSALGPFPVPRRRASSMAPTAAPSPRSDGPPRGVAPVDRAPHRRSRPSRPACSCASLTRPAGGFGRPRVSTPVGGTQYVAPVPVTILPLGLRGHRFTHGRHVDRHRLPGRGGGHSVPRPGVTCHSPRRAASPASLSAR